MLKVDMVEGKDQPKELLECEFEIVRWEDCWPPFVHTKKYFSTGWYVILDSGFCMLKGIVDLKCEEIFASALIKKGRYWTSKVTVMHLSHTSV